MATWIVFLHLLLPSIAPAATPAKPAPSVEASGRYAGVEALFAKFDAEAAVDVIILD
ncbi:MAG: hypothetical protein H6710_23705 [Myxococcales bacterium]|nr:hypothetical protein [Myxococcales bacterium]MCB9705818.1 hypothetical protein [Myxococcales bacterium]